MASILIKPSLGYHPIRCFLLNSSSLRLILGTRKDFAFHLILNLQQSVYGLVVKQFNYVELKRRQMDIKNGTKKQSLSMKCFSVIRLQLSLSDFILTLIQVLLMNLGE